MATAAPPTEERSIRRPAGPPRLVLHEIPWELYERLRAEESNWGIRMSYDRGELELMSPSQRHGESARRFDCFVMELADILDFKCKPLGATTWKKPERLKAKEADACFYISNYERIRGRQIDLEVDPPPDLAIEVEVSRDAANSLGIYQTIGVPEVWRFDGESLRIHIRAEHGGYVESDRSRALPFLHPGEVVEWMRKAEESDDDVTWKRQVREWARVELRPRLARD